MLKLRSLIFSFVVFITAFIISIKLKYNILSDKMYEKMSNSEDIMPRIRSPFARALYNKHIKKHIYDTEDHSQWYEVNTTLLSPSEKKSFMQLTKDAETQKFLDNCFEKSDWFFTQLYHSFAKMCLQLFITSTSANGLLDRGSMFVLSRNQFLQLMNKDESWVTGSLLDLGAGDGKVTDKLASLFHTVYATEISKVMQWRLSQKGYKILPIDKWFDAETAKTESVSFEGYPLFDVVSCLNLFDRCDNPVTLLNQIRKVLKPNTGRLFVALVLPVKQYVESKKSRIPEELIKVPFSKSWESQLGPLVTNFFEANGFLLESWSRVPYLCEGDFAEPFYRLNDIVMVLKRDENFEQRPAHDFD